MGVAAHAGFSYAEKECRPGPRQRPVLGRRPRKLRRTNQLARDGSIKPWPLRRLHHHRLIKLHPSQCLPLPARNKNKKVSAAASPRQKKKRARFPLTNRYRYNFSLLAAFFQTPKETPNPAAKSWKIKMASCLCDGNFKNGAPSERSDRRHDLNNDDTDTQSRTATCMAFGETES
jgi:hypothetical protein